MATEGYLLFEDFDGWMRMPGLRLLCTSQQPVSDIQSQETEQFILVIMKVYPVPVLVLSSAALSKEPSSSQHEGCNSPVEALHLQATEDKGVSCLVTALA
jgi:hypothetical protein